MTDLAERIKLAAHKVGGLKQLSEIIGVPRRTLGNWLTGTNPKPDALRAIAKATGVSLDWLITGEGMPDEDDFSVALKRENRAIAIRDREAVEFDAALSNALKRGSQTRQVAVEPEALQRLIDNVDNMSQSLGAMVQRLEPPPPPPATVKYFPHPASAGWGRAVTDDESAEDLDMEAFFTRLLGINVDYASLFQIKGDSMFPTLRHGDWAILDRQQRKIIDNEIFVFSVENDLYIKRATTSPDGDLCWQSDNDDYKPICLKGDEITRMKVVGRVTNVIRAV